MQNIIPTELAHVLFREVVVFRSDSLSSSNQIIRNKKHKPKLHCETGNESCIDLCARMGTAMKAGEGHNTRDGCYEHKDMNGLQMKVSSETIK